MVRHTVGQGHWGDWGGRRVGTGVEHTWWPQQVRKEVRGKNNTQMCARIIAGA